MVEVVPGSLLDLRWDDDQPLRTTFEDRGDTILVTVHQSGFGGDPSAARAIESMSRFTLVLLSLKMSLEHGIEGDVMYDEFTDVDVDVDDADR